MRPRPDPRRNSREFRADFRAEIVSLPPLCRPSGWVAQWRRIGNLSILNRRGPLSFA